MVLHAPHAFLGHISLRLANQAAQVALQDIILMQLVRLRVLQLALLAPIRLLEHPLAEVALRDTIHQPRPSQAARAVQRELSPHRLD